MTEVVLRPMTPEEFHDWRPWAIADYAREDVEHKGVDPDRARENMAAFLESVIPRGPRTEGHRISVVEDAETGERVGYTWWSERELDAGSAAWVYDVYIDESRRGRGYGRALMRAVEAQVREAGLGRMELHVWVDNDPATSLYRSLGFVPTGMEMYKVLES
jgi:ribosomal protein S18 acetylase RimI-like enzyme